MSSGTHPSRGMIETLRDTPAINYIYMLCIILILAVFIEYLGIGIFMKQNIDETDYTTIETCSSSSNEYRKKLNQHKMFFEYMFVIHTILLLIIFIFFVRNKYGQSYIGFR